MLKGTNQDVVQLILPINQKEPKHYFPKALNFIFLKNAFSFPFWGWWVTNQRMRNAGDSVQSNKLLLRDSECKFLLGAGWGRCKESPLPTFCLMQATWCSVWTYEHLSEHAGKMFLKFKSFPCHFYNFGCEPPYYLPYIY